MWPRLGAVHLAMWAMLEATPDTVAGLSVGGTPAATGEANPFPDGTPAVRRRARAFPLDLRPWLGLIDFYGVRTVWRL